MTTLRLNRAEATAVPFVITDDAGGLTGKRVTWALAQTTAEPQAFAKKSDFGASSADITLTLVTPERIEGAINLFPADFDTLTVPTYAASLWVDSGAADDRCVTPGGADFVLIVGNVDRA